MSCHFLMGFAHYAVTSSSDPDEYFVRGIKTKEDRGITNSMALCCTQKKKKTFGRAIHTSRGTTPVSEGEFRQDELVPPISGVHASKREEHTNTLVRLCVDFRCCRLESMPLPGLACSALLHVADSSRLVLV